MCPAVSGRQITVRLGSVDIVGRRWRSEWGAQGCATISQPHHNSCGAVGWIEGECRSAVPRARFDGVQRVLLQSRRVGCCSSDRSGSRWRWEWGVSGGSLRSPERDGDRNLRSSRRTGPWRGELGVPMMMLVSTMLRSLSMSSGNLRSSKRSTPVPSPSNNGHRLQPANTRGLPIPKGIRRSSRSQPTSS